MSNPDETFNQSTNNTWDQMFMRDYIGPKCADYRMSASLKTIWSDSSDDRASSSASNVDLSTLDVGHLTHGYFPPKYRHQPLMEYVQFGDNVIKIQNVPPYPANPAQAFGTGSHHNVANNNAHSNGHSWRVIKSRNGGHFSFDHKHNENQPYGSRLTPTSPSGLSPMSPPGFSSISPRGFNPMSAPLPGAQMEAFLQQVNVIVDNGFLDRKILNENISPDTFDLVQMLVFYVMEYSRAKSHQANQSEIQNTFYKINLIQKEIAKCQSHHMEQKRVQQEIVDSYSIYDARQPNSMGSQYGQANARKGNQYGQMNARNSPWQNVPSTETSNQRLGHRQYDRYARPSSAAPPANFTFLPKAKNTDKRSQHHRFYPLRDGSFPSPN